MHETQSGIFTLLLEILTRKCKSLGYYIVKEAGKLKRKRQSSISNLRNENNQEMKSKEIETVKSVPGASRKLENQGTQCFFFCFT